MLYPFLWDLISVMSPATVMLSFSLLRAEGASRRGDWSPRAGTNGDPYTGYQGQTPLARWITASLPVTIQPANDCAVDAPAGYAATPLLQIPNRSTKSKARILT